MYNDEFCASEDSVIINCDPCQFDDIQKEARAFCYDCNEYLCQQCLQFHRKFQAFRQHHILQGDSMPTTRKETKPKLTLKLCDNHRMNEVQFYCRKHECVFCSLCKAAKHSKCDCKFIDELVSVNENQFKFDNIVKKVEDIKTKFEQLRSVQIKKIDSTAADYKLQGKQLDDARKEMNLFFDKLANEIDEQEKKVKAYTKELKGDVQMCTDVVNYIASLKENIQDVSQSNDRVAIFSATCKLEKMTEEYATLKENILPKEIPEPSRNVIQILTKIRDIFKTMDEKMDVKSSQEIHGNENEHADFSQNLSSKDEFNIDEVTYKDANDSRVSKRNNTWRNARDNVMKNGDQSEALNKNIADIKIERSDHFENNNPATKISGAQNQEMSFYNVKQKIVSYHSIDDETNDSDCDITGSLFLPDGSFVLCDHGNSKVTLLDRNFKILHQLLFDGNVWDVAMLNKNEIIVTLKHNKELKFIQVASGKLYKGKRINLKMVPWGIAVYKHYIFITFHNNPGNGCIEVRDTSGRIIRTIGKSETGEELFTTPFYVAVNQHNGDIYVTDSRKNSLICLSLKGELLFTVNNEKLKWPRKIILDDYGNCILCASLGNKVLQIRNKEKSQVSSNYELADLKVWLNECNRPQTVPMRWEDQTMVLGLNKTNKIQVVKLIFTNQQ